MAEYETDISNSEKCPQFFKIYTPAHCSSQLRLPPAFIKYFEGCLPFKFILETRTRKSWEVNMNKIGDDVYFKSGWEKFVQDNLLEFGDFLIFYYNGGSNFFVSIFGTNNCSKEIEQVANKESENQPIQVEQNETNETGSQVKEVPIEDCKLSFQVTMQQTYITKGYLETGREFYKGVKEHRAMAKLQHMGKTWDVKVAGCNNQRYRFCHDWRSFVADNRLVAGDICFFKMTDIKPDYYVFQVSFSRVI